MVKIKPESLILFLILAIAFSLRIFSLSDNPPSLNWDEASHGFNAYSILKTGNDEWGERLPLIFRCFGDYKLPLYIYLTVPFIFIFGMSPLAVRLVSVLSGVGLVYVTYLIVLRLTKKKPVSLMAAFFTAITPWGLFLSRVAVEANLSSFLFSFGFYFWLRWLDNQRSHNPLAWTFLFWGLSINSYNSARVIVPIFVLLTGVIAFREKKLKQLFLPTVILTLFILPIVLQLFDRSGQARFFWVSPIDQGALNRIHENRGASELPHLITRLLYNRPVYFVTFVVKNYLKHFSPRFWFIKGGSHYQFSFPNKELVFFVLAPFLLFGLIKSLKDRWLKWLVFWLLISFIPSAITRDAPHVLRIILGLVPFLSLSSIGLFSLLELFAQRSRFKGKAVVIVFLLSLLCQFFIWWKDYWQIYRPFYSWSWQYGFRQTVDFVRENYSKYDRIIFSKKYGEPHIFILFWWPWQPSYYQQDANKVSDYHAHWYWVDAFDKFQFWNDWEVKARLLMLEDRGFEGKVLLVTSPGNYVDQGQLLKEISFLDGIPAIDIVSYQF